jgi:hypothetical protein
MLEVQAAKSVKEKEEEILLLNARTITYKNVSYSVRVFVCLCVSSY